MHVDASDEHGFALAFLAGYLSHIGARSLLDIGSGTGRALVYLKQRLPDLTIVGIEPSADLRAVAYRKHGLAVTELVDGNAMALEFRDATFDIVCEFGALHHIERPSRAVDEMLRVARLGIFISDSNNFGQGRFLTRTIKQTLHAVGLWPAANWIRTRGRGYEVSAGDGLYYSYSVFNDYRRIQAACASVHIVNTGAAGIDPYRTSPHVALLGVKRADPASKA